MIKRLFDIAVSFITLIVLSPILMIIGALIKVESRGSLFYTQERLGMNGKIFNLLKFRSMSNEKRNESVQVTSENPQVTKVGNVIRRLKIDELPQLLNVINGDMSIVGPRPCLPSLIESFNEDGHKRLLVRPGLTGLAQVNGNIHLSWEERWKYDRHYVETISIPLDLKIIFQTVLVILLGEKWGLKH
jgi:undecaprenyl phosphate N,N'-diacetylbacillosamine 1-phosphate transferase